MLMAPLLMAPRAITVTRPLLGAPAPHPSRPTGRMLGFRGAKGEPHPGTARALAAPAFSQVPGSALVRLRTLPRPAFHSPRPSPPPPLPRPRAASSGPQDGPPDPGPPPLPNAGTGPDAVAQLQRLQSALTALTAASAEATAAVEALSVSLQGGAAPPPGSLPPMTPTGAFFGVLSGLPLGLPVATRADPAKPTSPGPVPVPGAGTAADAAGAGGEREGARGEGAEVGVKAAGGGASGVGTQSDLAVRLQQAFVQARVEGLGRPPELALEDFVRLCTEARAQGTPLQELQLQLILAEGALPAPFGKRAMVPGEEGGAQEPPSLAGEAEDIRARTLWVRFVYSTLALVDAIKDGRGYIEALPPYEGAPPDAMDGYVQQTVRSAIEDGQDLDYVLAQQRASAPIASPFVRLMRQNQLLILIALRDGLAA